MLIFTNDIALMPDTIVGLQKQLYVLHEFCSDCKLTVNISKTNILVFKKGGRLAKREQWKYGNDNLEDVHIFVCKRFLKLSTTSCNNAVLGDLGRYPMYIYILQKMYFILVTNTHFT
jgi:hypothetical protein